VLKRYQHVGILEYIDNLNRISVLLVSSLLLRSFNAKQIIQSAAVVISQSHEIIIIHDVAS